MTFWARSPPVLLVLGLLLFFPVLILALIASFHSFSGLKADTTTHRGKGRKPGDQYQDGNLLVTTDLAINGVHSRMGMSDPTLGKVKQSIEVGFGPVFCRFFGPKLRPRTYAPLRRTRRLALPCLQLAPHCFVTGPTTCVPRGCLHPRSMPGR